ncbi:amino acid adenylation domain-containing protein [Crocosphaera sp. Alani8]|uniref:amino acid adenylation domain-containing protein n=1 Tax=Crocosphaera sp. Alani8 TaxID=3038952 RepID=UPI00313C472D
MMDKKKNIEDIYPLSPLQEGILFHTLLTPHSGVYQPQICLTLTGSLNIPKFKQAWETIIIKHQLFRVSFHWEKRDRPFQAVYRRVNFPWEELDWRDISLDKQEYKLEEFLEIDRKQNFDLKNPPQMRLNLIYSTENSYYLVWTQHHLIIDGWSSGLVIKEVFQEYYGKIEVNYTRPYGDYIGWLQQQDQNISKDYWKEQLKGFITPTIWGVERNSIVEKDSPQAEQEIILSSNITTTLKSLTQQQELTLNTLIRGALALLLSYYSGETDIVFGATCSGRSATLEGINSMVGLFINTLPVRVKVSPKQDLIPWLKRLQTQQGEASRYEHVSLLEIQENSDLASGTSLFDTILVFENYPVDPSIIQESESLTIDSVKSTEWTSLPLTILVGGTNQLSIKMKYHCDRFSDQMINRLLGHFKTVLNNIINNPQQQLWEISLLTDHEKQLLIKDNREKATENGHICIPQLFEQQVEKNPQNIAVTFENKKLTYEELNNKANQLAHYLGSLGVKPETLVGVCSKRSLGMVIAILAILKAGAAYVPIESTYPPQRINYILQDAQLSILLTDQDFSEVPVKTVVNLNTDNLKLSQYPNTNPTPKLTPNHSIYAIYTSGSTGNPKGVINTHRGLINRLNWMQKAYHLTPDDLVLQKTPYTFDVSVWEFFWTLLNGACLVMSKPEGHQDSGYLASLIIEENITTVHFVPSMLQVFLEEEKASQCNSLKRVICSGEAFSVDLKNRFFQTFDATLHNLYGPTEAAIDVTAWTCQADDLSVPIGKPIDNIQAYVFNPQLQLLPMGVAGELYLGGEGLARGYLNRPDLTAESFVPNPFDAGERLYKTGDLVRLGEDGNIEYLGRIDNQVKIRGVRLELGEIETTLNQHPDIIACVVLAKEFAEGDRRLIAYIQTEQTEDISGELRQFLSERLPNYGIPSVFIRLDSFPLTSNGKLDRKSLLSLNYSSTREIIAPRNETEEAIAEIWREILKIDNLSVEDNFFELGGNSLIATRVNSRLRQTFSLDLPLRTLFEKPTIGTLAERIKVIQLSVQPRDIDSSKPRKEIEI